MIKDTLSSTCQLWKLNGGSQLLHQTKGNRNRIGTIVNFKIQLIYCPACDQKFKNYKEYHIHRAEVKKTEIRHIFFIK